MGVGMPATLKLQEFGSQVQAVFGSNPYHVGSSVENKTGWRDVDVRMILTDEEWIAWGFGHPDYVEHRDEKWVALCLAFSALGREMTGLPIDFQIQQMTRANERYGGHRRDALGFVPHRFVPDAHLDAPTWHAVHAHSWTPFPFAATLECHICRQPMNGDGMRCQECGGAACGKCAAEDDI